MDNVTFDPRPCTGCGACAAICPTQALRLELDSAGFYTAVADSARCTHCGLCLQVCPRGMDGGSIRDAALFAMRSADDAVVRGCASGGIAHELARQTIANGGAAVGVAYNYETDRAEHRVVRDAARLTELDGSKYLQSDASRAFRQVLEAAKRDETARFAVFGMPCQIAGLARAAEAAGVRQQLLLTELFCHGVPSYRVWDAQCAIIRKSLGDGPFDAVRFRDKADGWHNYCLRVRARGREWKLPRQRGLHYPVYFENILLGDSCYGCPWRAEQSLADLRLGDYWGAAFSDRTDGVSAVLALTDTGRAAIAQLRTNVTQLPATTLPQLLACQNMAGYAPNPLHDTALQQLRTGNDVQTVARTYRRHQSAKQKLKRALLYWSSFLPQALVKRLRRMRS